jgi:hypothetical protein
MSRLSLVCVVPDGTAPTDGSQPRTASETVVRWPVGDSGDIDLAVQHADGSAYDLTDCTLTLVCRRHMADTTPAFAYEAAIDATPQGGTAPGTATVSVDGDDTEAMIAGATYWFDVLLTDAGDVLWHVLPASKWLPAMTVARAGEPAP